MIEDFYHVTGLGVKWVPGRIFLKNNVIQCIILTHSLNLKACIFSFSLKDGVPKTVFSTPPKIYEFSTIACHIRRSSPHRTLCSTQTDSRHPKMVLMCRFIFQIILKGGKCQKSRLMSEPQKCRCSPVLCHHCIHILSLSCNIQCSFPRRTLSAHKQLDITNKD